MVPTKDGYMKDMGEESQETYSIFHQNHGRLEPGMWIYGMIIGVYTDGRVHSLKRGSTQRLGHASQVVYCIHSAVSGL